METQYIKKNSIGTFYYSDKEMKVLHREVGAAMELKGGTKLWCVNGQVHREDGPACEYYNGDKYWYKNGFLHREDGPAIECPSGTKSWYLNGKPLSEKEFNEHMKPSLKGKEVSVTIDGNTYKAIIQ